MSEQRFAMDDEEDEPGGMSVASGRVFEIAPENPRTWVWEEQPDAFVPKEKALPPGPVQSWRFPLTSMTVVELNVVPA